MDDLLKEKERLENILNNFKQETDEQQKLKIIKLLHEYNDVKDATQILIGALANVDNVTIKEIHKRLDLKDED